MGADDRDAELVSRYLDTGDLRLFDELVVRYRDRMMRLVLSVLGPELAADAEDVVQEAFLGAHDRLRGFRGQSKFGSWLYRITYNRALDHRRRFSGCQSESSHRQTRAAVPSSAPRRSTPC